MRYIIEYNSGDGCTFSCQNTFPIIFDGDKATLEVEFLEAVEKAKFHTFDFGGNVFYADTFYMDEIDYKRNTFISIYQEPNFYTVDEWFAIVEKRAGK